MNVINYLILILVGLTLTSTNAQQSNEEVITIEFLSTDDTPITVESSFLFKKDSANDNLEKVKGVTPFSLTGEGIAYGAIIRKIEGDAALRVVIYKGANENRRQTATGEGNVIFLYDYGDGRQEVGSY